MTKLLIAVLNKNYGKYLYQMLETITRQDAIDYEVVCVDIGECPRNIEIFKQFNIQVVSYKNCNYPRALNKVIKRYRGKVQAITCVGIVALYESDFVSSMLHFLEYPGSIVYCETIVDFIGKFYPINSLYAELKQCRNPLYLAAMAIRLILFETIGQFDESIDHLWGWEFILRAYRLQKRFRYIDKVMVERLRVAPALTPDFTDHVVRLELSDLKYIFTGGR